MIGRTPSRPSRGRSAFEDMTMVDGTSDGGAGQRPAETEEEELCRLFLGNSEYAIVSQSLAVLERQLEQAHKDMKLLQDLKSQATREPEAFLSLLERPILGDQMFPKLQLVKLVPDFDLHPYQRRLPRRAVSKYDQNLEYLLGRLRALQRARPSADAEMLSSLLPLRMPASAAPLAEAAAASHEQHVVRKRFTEIAGALRSASAPALYATPSSAPTLSRSKYGSSLIDRGALFSPQPVKAAPSVQFSLPFLPIPAMDSSRAASPQASSSNPASPSPLGAGGDGGEAVLPLGSKKRKKHAKPGDSSHHNLPWTEEERRRLVELMEIYPEEQVNTRRYAKIAAAIGTRTAGQVANRINKLMHKQRKKLANASGGGGLSTFPSAGTEINEEGLDERVRETPEYREYRRLKRQIELLEANPDLSVHHGFQCDGCGMEPIVGDRWRCTRCHEPAAIDLCSACYEGGEFRSAAHRPDHRFLRH